MAQLGIRIPDEMKKRMDEKSDINWSKYIRRKIREKLDYPNSPRRIQKLVRQYSGDIRKLWILHMFSYNIKKEDIYEMAELIFGKEMDSEVDRIEIDLENSGLDKMYEKLDENQHIGEAIREAIEISGAVDIKKEVEERIKQLPDKVRKGIYILSFYVLDDLDREHAYIIPQGFERTWSIFTGDDVHMEDLFKTGIIYKDYYNSNAYGHWFHIIPGYGLDILGKLNENPKEFGIYGTSPNEYSIKKMMEKEDVKTFLRWMGGTKKYVDAHREEEEIQELGLESFKRIRDELVKEMILKFDYWPGRSRAGRRSSKPAQWIYKLQDESLKYITKILLENL